MNHGKMNAKVRGRITDFCEEGSGSGPVDRGRGGRPPAMPHARPAARGPAQGEVREGTGGRHAQQRVGPPGSSGKKAFAKVTPTNDELARRREARAEQADEEAKMTVTRRKADESHLPATGVFLWPDDGISASILGPEHRSLDSVRKTHEAHISYDRGPSAFDIAAASGDLAKGAAVGIRDKLSSLMERNDSARNLVLVDPRGNLENIVGFQLADAQQVDEPMFPAKPGESSVIFVAKAFQGHSDASDGPAKAALAKQTRLASIAFRLAYEDGLRKMHAWRERRVQMRVLLGRAVFRRCPRSLADGAQLAPDDFCNRVMGLDRPVELLRMDSAANLLRRAVRASVQDNPSTSGTNHTQRKKILEPLQGSVGLDDIRPSFKGLFKLRIPGTSEPIDLVVESSTGHAVGRPEWSRRVATLAPIEIFVLKPQESMSWKFEMVARDQAEPAGVLRGFVKAIKMLPCPSYTALQSTPRLVFSFDPGSVLDFAQQTVWTFRNRGRQLRLDITRTDFFDWKSALKADQDPKTVAPAEWEAVVRHESWIDESGATTGTVLSDVTNSRNRDAPKVANRGGGGLTAGAGSIFDAIGELIGGICGAEV